MPNLYHLMFTISSSAEAAFIHLSASTVKPAE